jgi:hypothetical protein
VPGAVKGHHPRLTRRKIMYRHYRNESFAQLTSSGVTASARRKFNVFIQRLCKPQPSMMCQPIGFSTLSISLWPKATQQEAPIPSFISRQLRASRRPTTFTTWKTKRFPNPGSVSTYASVCKKVQTFLYETDHSPSEPHHPHR